MPGFYPASHSIILITPAHTQPGTMYISTCSYHGSHEGNVNWDNSGDYLASTRLRTADFCETKSRAIRKTTHKGNDMEQYHEVCRITMSALNYTCIFIDFVR